MFVYWDSDFINPTVAPFARKVIPWDQKSMEQNRIFITLYNEMANSSEFVFKRNK